MLRLSSLLLALMQLLRLKFRQIVHASLSPNPYAGKEIGSKRLRHRHSNQYESGHLSKQAKSDECLPAGPAKHVDQVHSTLVWSDPADFSLSSTFSFAFYSADGGEGDRITQPEDAAGTFDPCTSSSPPNIGTYLRFSLVSQGLVGLHLNL